MNERILKTLEFEQVKTMIQQHLTTEQGEEEIRQLTPSNDEDTIQAWLDETEDGMKVQRLRGGLPIPKLNNIKPHMKRIEIGANLNGLELAEVSRVLSTTSELVRFIEDLKDSELEFQRLYFWEEQLTTLPELSGKLRRSVEEDGRVRDEASTELRTIRSQIRRSEQTIREQLDGLIRGKNAKYLSDSLITMRNDRYVIPVKQEYRGIFGGVVHDQSASGQTLFMEPKQIVELNNRLRQQQIAERTEIERILAELSAELVAPRKDILHNAYVLGR
ncbi:MAG: endonuclease MutS2, partial [Enterococcus sp.]